MKDLFLIPIMLAVVVFGYFVMAKIDSFIEENRRLIHAENRQNRMHIGYRNSGRRKQSFFE